MVAQSTATPLSSISSTVPTSLTAGGSSHIHIDSLKATNYRSIKNQTFKFGEGCNIILGQNNSGKTNILRLLNLVLGDGDLRLFYTEYYQLDAPLELEIELSNVDDAIMKQYDKSFSGGTIRVHYIWRKAERHPRFQFVQVARNQIAMQDHLDYLEPDSYSVGMQPDTILVETSSFTKPVGVDFQRVLLKMVRFVHIGNGERASEALSVGALFQRLVWYYIPKAQSRAGKASRIWAGWLNVRAAQAKSRTIKPGMPGYDQVISQLGIGADAIMLSDDLAKMCEDIANRMKETPGLNVRKIEPNYRSDDFVAAMIKAQPLPRPRNLAEMLQRLTLNVDDGLGVARPPQLNEPHTFSGTPNEQHGIGLRSLLTIAMMRLVMEKSGSAVIFGLDEPESGLHPHLQRSMVDMLGRMAISGQVFISTHSPVIAEMWHYRDFKDTLVLVRRSRRTYDGTTAKSFSRGSFTPSQLEDIRRYLLVAGSGILFASGVIIVEGPTEVGALPALARLKIRQNFDALNISVAAAQGVESIPAVMNLCSTLKIPYYAVFDMDGIASKSKSGIYKRMPGIISRDVAKLDSIVLAMKQREPNVEVPTPTSQELLAIRKVLKGLRCSAWEHDFEKTFVVGSRTNDRVGFITELYKQRYNVLNMGIPYYTTLSRASNSNIIKDLKKCKNEPFWRLFVEAWLPIDSSWANPELYDVLEEAIIALEKQM